MDPRADAVSPDARRASAQLRGAWLLLVASQLVRAIAIAIPWMGWWGWSAQRFVPLPVAITISVCTLLLLVPGFANRTLAALERLRAPSPIAAGVLALATATLVWLFPDRVQFIGDALFRQGVVEFGTGATALLPQSLPLDPALHLTL